MSRSQQVVVARVLALILPALVLWGGYRWLLAAPEQALSEPAMSMNQALAEVDPEVVLVGNSLVRHGLDTELIARNVADRPVRVATVAENGTGAAGATETRDGIDVLGVLNETANAREYLFGYYGEPGTPLFKIMVRDREWKYIYMANGGREQLFNMNDDPQELTNLAKERPEVLNLLREVAVSGCQSPGGKPALDGTALRSFPFKHREVKRIHQFARYRGVKDFPNHPKDVLDEWEKNGFKT